MGFCHYNLRDDIVRMKREENFSWTGILQNAYQNNFLVKKQEIVPQITKKNKHPSPG